MGMITFIRCVYGLKNQYRRVENARLCHAHQIQYKQIVAILSKNAKQKINIIDYPFPHPQRHS